MGNIKKSRHISVVFERQADDHLVVVARDLASLDEARKRAKQFAAEKPGTTYVPGRTYPPVKAHATTVVRFVDPDKCGKQQPDEGAEQEANGIQPEQ